MKVITRTFLALRALRERLGRPGPAIPILSFHRISALQPDHYLTFTPESFEHLLQQLQRHYTFVSLAEIDELLSRQKLDAPVAGVAFDDSYGCNATYAVPVLKSLGIPTTFFVSSGHVDTDDLMPGDLARGYRNIPNFTSAELRSMANDGLFEIGSHTVSHIDLSKSWDNERIRQELSESKASLAKLVGKPIERIAIPFGQRDHCSAAAISIAREVGYKRVYSFFGGRNRLTPGVPPRFVLQRIGPEYDDPEFVHACLENYRGRQTRLNEEALLPSDEFHPTAF